MHYQKPWPTKSTRQFTRGIYMACRLGELLHAKVEAPITNTLNTMVPYLTHTDALIFYQDQRLC